MCIKCDNFVIVMLFCQVGIEKETDGRKFFDLV